MSTRGKLASILVALAFAFAAPARGATLPSHAPLRILIVSDEVNPHGLSAAQLTQPGDLSTALTAPGNGLNLDPSPDAVLEIPTDNLPAATAALSMSIEDPAAYDVLIYFAHRIPMGASGGPQQADFVAAVSAFLTAGGGVISFHHGSYLSTGKQAILDLIGGTASGAVPWNTADGQNVIDVAPGHFITSNGVEYVDVLTYADLPRGIASGTYSYFNNTPDERYPSFQINAGAGEVELLFASNYNEGGTTHVLGFTHRRPEWAGVVVAYQPGEYQPNALDDRDGNNFQILANAIVYAAFEATAAVGEPSRNRLTLEPNRPNPFRDVTTIGFTLTEPSEVDVAVFDVAGSRVVTLAHGHRDAGRHDVVWNSRRVGVLVAPGVYLCRLTTSLGSQSRKLLLVQ